MEKIIRDLSLSISLPECAPGSIRSQVESVSTPRPTPTPTEPAGRPYRIEEKAFDESECAYWEQYGITPNVLQRYGVRSLRSFRSETAQIPENIIESLRLRFRHIILLYDIG